MAPGAEAFSRSDKLLVPRPSPLPPGGAQKHGAWRVHMNGAPSCTYLCSCFPATSVTSMPFSICFTSFPGLLTPVNPGRREERAKLWFRELDTKTKDRENPSFGRDMAHCRATRKLRNQEVLGRGHRLAPGTGAGGLWS